MNFKDLLKDVDWAKVLGSIANWIAENPNVYQAAIGMVFSLFTTVWSLKGMSEEEAKEQFMADMEEFKKIPKLPMDFQV